MAVPGIAADYLRRDVAAIIPPGSLIDGDVPTLVKRLAALPATTTNRTGTRTGDPYFTDGKRAALLLSTRRTAPRFVAWA